MTCQSALSRPDISGWGEIPWYRRLLGDEPVAWIVLADDVPEESKTKVEQAFPEALVERERVRAQGALTSAASVFSIAASLRR